MTAERKHPVNGAYKKDHEQGDDSMSDYDNAIFRLATEQEAEPEDYTGEEGFYTAGNAASRKKRILRRARAFTGATATGRKWNG